MGGKDTETCGRCAMSSVSGLVEGERDPYEGGRIELDGDDLRRVSPGAWLGAVSERLDAFASRLVHGR